MSVEDDFLKAYQGHEEEAPSHSDQETASPDASSAPETSAPASELPQSQAELVPYLYNKYGGERATGVVNVLEQNNREGLGADVLQWTKDLSFDELKEIFQMLNKTNLYPEDKMRRIAWALQVKNDPTSKTALSLDFPG